MFFCVKSVPKWVLMLIINDIIYIDRGNIYEYNRYNNKEEK